MVPMAVIALLVARPGSSTLTAQPGTRDLRRMDVCALVPGPGLAGALGGTLSKATPFNDPEGSFARCTYIVTPNGAPAGVTKGYGLWVYPHGDFEALRQYTSAPVTSVAGIGDAAESFVDPDDGRYKLRVLLRNDVAIEATGDAAAPARKVAEFAVAALRSSR
jgi:hypothetical protein